VKRRDQIPPILRDIIEESKRSLTRGEIDAGEAFVLGHGTLGELLEAKRAAKQTRSPR
jgi:hypothetical protein